MQKSFIAIALALTLTCAFAYVAPNNTAYVKAPQSVALNNDSNFTNSTNVGLASINIGELDLFASNFSKNDQNVSAGSYAAAWRKLDGKTLTASTNTTSTVAGTPLFITVLNNYVITLNVENDTNSVLQIAVYQSALTGGATAPRFYATSNTNATWTPAYKSLVAISKTVYVFYTASGTQDATKINVTNFVAGGAKGSLEFTLTSALNNTLLAAPFSAAWGESLGSSQLFALWQEGAALKDATIDVSKGTVTSNTVGNWFPNYTCVAYATDKKLFGDLCRITDGNGNQSIYVRSNTTSLTLLTVNNASLSGYEAVYAYGPYIAIFYMDTVSTAHNTTYSYEIWNLDTSAIFRSRTTFLTADNFVQFFRVTSAGLYTFISDRFVNIGNITNPNVVNFQNVQVGLVLGSSYLTSVLGFILTIVAGLLLF